ncbi:hypothetical protein CDAR_421841 [Caerostris darwini]|uniref:Uncharacterized protein n=1 Tax=Caerostris darwini TaxID=1538125 RepID=A0AAV4VB53_9ARAC|nr:hypothetical protein CDAR_421841 [Caerostris darwini]
MTNEGSECHCPHSKHNADSASSWNIQVSLRHGGEMEAVNIPPNVTGEGKPIRNAKSSIYIRKRKRRSNAGKISAAAALRKTRKVILFSFFFSGGLGRKNFSSGNPAYRAEKIRDQT